MEACGLDMSGSRLLQGSDILMTVVIGWILRGLGPYRPGESIIPTELKE